MAGGENIELSTEAGLHPLGWVGWVEGEGCGVWGAEYTKTDISVTSELSSSLREGQFCPFSRKKGCVVRYGSVTIMTIMITVEFNTSMRQAGSDYGSSN